MILMITGKGRPACSDALGSSIKVSTKEVVRATHKDKRRVKVLTVLRIV